MFRNLTILLLLACKSPSVADSTQDPASATDGVIKASAKANLRFKRAERLNNDFAQALALPSVCKEGERECATDVHKVALGGVDPYAIGLYEAPTETGTSAPIVVDRIALSACKQRAAIDRTGPALIFANVADEAGRTAAVQTLYSRVLRRDPTSGELARLLALYTDTGEQWPLLSCFAVLTSNESLFY